MKHRLQGTTGLDAISIEGGLLSTSLFNRLRHYQLPGQSPEDYQVEQGLKLSDELGRYWRIAQARWEQFNEQRNREDIDQTKLTVESWLLPILDKVLDYEVTKGGLLQIGERTFPIEYLASGDAVPLVLVDPHTDLDKGDMKFGQEGRRRSPTGLAQEYLNAESNCLWSIVSNGLTLRLLRDNPAMTRPAYIAIDLERIFTEQLFVDFTVFWLLLHASRLQPRDGSPENCWLEQWRGQGQQDGERVLNGLRHGVTDALRILGSGFLGNPKNTALRSAIESGELTTDRFFQELLRLVYRFLFLLTAEDRRVILDPSADSATSELYTEGYSLGHLRDRSRFRRYYDHHADAWQQLQVTFAGFAHGQSRLCQPALGGLFDVRQCPRLDASELENCHLYEALFRLSYFESGKVLVRINYRDMDTEELGSVYESLLELVPRIDLDGQWRFSFMGDDAGEGAAAGHARKLTGSYYTPDSLVQELIKSALEPVMEQRLRDNSANPRDAILSISVCDPACGSGHFLLAAARRLAAELARIDAGTNQPSEEDYRHALREVVRHSIYGVDMNPLSVELCRTALWLETIEPGKPLGFLDTHIQLGNSLVGLLDPVLIQKGIPDDAYKPLTGDDKQVAARLKKRNKIDRQQKDLLVAHHTELAACAGGIAEMPEDDLEQIEEKREAWLELMQGRACQDEKLRANLFTSAFFAPKTQANAERVPTNMELTALESGETIPGAMRELVSKLAHNNRFFHWYLAFPDVFAQDGGKSGGFDVMLGNPPWERIKLQEQEFFASRSPQIAQARNKAERLKRIKWLSEGYLMARLHPELGLGDEPDANEIRLYQEFVDAGYGAEGASAFARLSGRNPLTGMGDVNLYALFAEHFLKAINPNGRTGFIVPSGIASDDSTKTFFSYMNEENRLVSLFSFENEEFIFRSVHHSYRFCLITAAGCKVKRPGEFVFFARKPNQLYDKERRFILTQDDISLVNPNTRTCPVFRSARDAELTKKIYRSAPVLILDANENMQERNPWCLRVRRVFDMAKADVIGNCVRECTPGYLVMNEAKMIHQYDHRWATYESDGKTSRDSLIDEKQNTAYQIRPRYWVDEWQVTLRTAQAPKLILDAAKQEDVIALKGAVVLWTIGAAHTRMDTETAAKLLAVIAPNQNDNLFVGGEDDVYKLACTMIEQSPLSDEEFTGLVQWIDRGGGDLWPLVRYLLENRRPNYLLAWRDITSAHVYRTVIAALLPLSGTDFTLRVNLGRLVNKKLYSCLLANLNCLVLDFVARQKVGGTHLADFILKQLPVITPGQYSKVDIGYILPRVLELTYSSHDLKPFAEDLDYDGEPFLFDPERRHRLKSEIDAYYAKLYGLARDELRYILDPSDVMGEDYPSETFRVLKNKEIKEFGDFRTGNMVLHYYDRIQMFEEQGKPYEPDYSPPPVELPITAVDGE